MKLPNEILSQFYQCTPDKQINTSGMSVLIPFHGKSRYKQLLNCVSWAHNQTLQPIEIIVIEDGPEQVVIEADLKKYTNVSYIFHHSNTAFCKTACFNIGASNAKYDFLCGIDADILIPTDFLHIGYEELQKTDACFLADDIFYLCGEMKDIFDFNYTGKTWQTHRATWQFHGGTFFIKKQKYFDIGGHDEAFKGYGSEDSEFYKRVHDILNVTTGNYAILHQEHGREKYAHVNEEKNKQYLYAVQNIPLKTRVQQLYKSNKNLKIQNSSLNITQIPDKLPIAFDSDSRLKRLRKLQAPVTENIQQKNLVPEMEQRRRRVLGF